MTEATLDQAIKLGLTEDEFNKIKEVLGRTPNFNETAVYSVMWSEHCSYKNSIKWLKTLPKDGPMMLAKAGEENAGLVDIGDGWGCSFKIESHNHPSAIEPFQGAATGVGGIHRDIFTMGARPIAALNSLRFGNINEDKTKHLVKGVVKGIGHYGNCFGVPTVAGETYFENSYNTNPLVNAMSIGILKEGKMVSATSYGEGNPVFIVGSDTGKDGIGGASFASADISENSVQDLPAVQVGDPFQEKKLLEACLEIVESDAIIGMQDMGAAGIACSTSEMSAKGEHGMIIHLDKVPTRQKNMLSWEMLLSESQERMLVVIKKGREKEITSIFDKWDIHCVQIGEVTTDKNLKFYNNGNLEADLPAESLVLGGGAPVYEREYKTPSYFSEIEKYNIDSIEQSSDLQSIAKKIIALPNICSKKWIYEQYDSMVGTVNSNTNAPSDAAVVWVKETQKGIAATVDCNGRYVFANPFIGAQIAVAECARNIVCSGAKPMAITNCLNFGNPYNPEVYFQFVKAIEGMTVACNSFGTPVTGGNVSFYNQSPDGAVYPTPTIGMIGIIDDISKKMTLNFKSEGDIIILLGENKNDISSSEYLHKIKNIEFSPCPHFDLEQEQNLQKITLELIDKNILSSAHDISEGGLFTTVLESAMVNNFGFEINSDADIRKDAFLFGEAQNRIIVSLNETKVDDLKEIVGNHPFSILGKVKSSEIKIDNENWGNIADWKQIYNSSLANFIEK